MTWPASLACRELILILRLDSSIHTRDMALRPWYTLFA